MRMLAEVVTRGQALKFAIAVLALASLIVAWGFLSPVIGQEAPLSPLGITLVGPRQFLSDSPAALRVIVFNHAEGRPAGEATVSLRLARVGQLATTRLFIGRTNAQGTLDASFRIPALEPGDYNLVIAATSGPHREQIEQRIQIVRAYRVLLTTDKPIYQPNQVMHLRALVLRVPDLRAVGDMPLTLEVADGKGNKVFKYVGKTNAYGIAFADFQLADEVNMGRYKIRAIVEEQTTEKTVTVERYVLPKFKVSLQTNRNFYLPGNQVEGTLQADYFFGKPVAGAQVTIVAKTFDVAYQEIQRIEGKTDEEGAFRFDLEVPLHLVGQPLEQGQAFIQFDVEVTDTAEHTESIVKTVAVAGAPVMINAVPEAGDLIPGQENVVYLLVSTPDGKPAQATVTVVSAEVEGEQKVEIVEARARTDAVGCASVRLRVPKLEAGSLPRRGFMWRGSDYAPPLRLRVQAATPNGEKVEREIALDARPQSGGSLLLRTDRALYNVGGEVQAVAFTSPAERGTVYFDVIKDKQTMLTRAADVVNGQARLTFSLSPDLSGSVFLSAYRIMPDNNIVRDTRPLYIEPAKDLNIKVAPDQDTYQPGGEAKIGFTVTDSGGAPVAAALGVNIVDESVFALQELQPGMEKVYFYLEQELMKPRYEIHGLELPGIVTEAVKPGPVVPLLEDASRQQAARLLFATATVPDLPTVFVDSYSDRLARAREKWTEMMRPLVEHIQKAIEAYRNAHDGEPPSAEEGVTALIRGGYLKQKDLLDPWGNRMTVGPADEDRFYYAMVFSPGPDGKPNTEDDLYLYSFDPGFAFATAEQAREGRWGGMKMRDGVVFAMPLAEAGAAGPAGPPDALPTPPPMPPGEAPVPTTAPGLPEKESVRVRQFFPETMFVEPALITGPDGKATLSVPMADSITTWRLTALANSAQGLLGSTTSGLRCFQDFFIDIDLPVALTQGDQVSIPVAIYNYLPDKQTVRLEITKEDWFDLKSEPAVEMEILANNVNVRYFTIVAQRLGDHKLTVHGLGTKMSDAITRSIRIEPDGKRTEASISDRLERTVTQAVTIPAEAIPEASNLFVKIFPGIFSTIVEGMDAIFQMPFGCFEQTSSATYPNILALDYMKTVGQITPEIQMKAQGFINTGYQRLVSYEVPGGGFSWFGDAPANQILTAYGLMEFADMAKVHPVDESIIGRTQQWLLKQQQPSGAWKPDKEYLHQESWGRIQNQELPPTSYITWALAWSGYKGAELDSAVGFLLENRQQAKDPYVLAMLANALVTVDNARRQGKLSPTTVEVLDSLLAQAKRKDGKTWWETEMTGFTHSSGKQADLETTGMAAIAYITAGQYPDVASEILNYLVANKDPRGTWGSTQATVLALRALVLSTGSRTTKVSGNVEVLVNGEPAGTHKLTPENADVVWQVDCKPHVKPGANQVEIRFAGEGTTLYQIVSRYYLPWERVPKPATELLSIKVDYDRTRLATNDEVTARVTVTNNTSATTSMIIVDLGIPPGFTVNYEDFEALVKEGTINKYNPTSRQVIVYLEKLEPKQKVQFDYRLKARFPIRAQSPVTTVYEYYNPENRAEAVPRSLVVEG